MYVYILYLNIYSNRPVPQKGHVSWTRETSFDDRPKKFDSGRRRRLTLPSGWSSLTDQFGEGEVQIVANVFVLLLFVDELVFEPVDLLLEFLHGSLRELGACLSLL